MRFAIDGGAHGIVAFGLAGEVLKLTAEERKALTVAIVDEARGAVPVLVGAGAPSVRGAIELARQAEDAGASCVVLPAPLIGAVGADALADYFVRVAAAVSLPVMIQDAPAHIGVRLGPELVERIGAAAPNVRLVKLEAGPAEMSGWIAALGAEFSLWGGDGGAYLLDCVRAGAAGIIPGVDLVDVLVRVYQAQAAGDEARADQLFAQVLPMLVFEMQHSIDHFNACAKRVLVHRGVLSNGDLRDPAEQLGDASRWLLERHVTALEALVGELRAD